MIFFHQNLFNQFLFYYNILDTQVKKIFCLAYQQLPYDYVHLFEIFIDPAKIVIYMAELSLFVYALNIFRPLGLGYLDVMDIILVESKYVYQDYSPRQLSFISIKTCQEHNY